MTPPQQQQQLPTQALAPDLRLQPPTPIALSQPLIPLPATAVPAPIALKRTMSLLGPSLPTAAPPFTPGPTLPPPLAPPSVSRSATLPPHRKPPVAAGPDKPTQPRWVTFDDDSDFPQGAAAPGLPPPACPLPPQARPPCSGFDPNPSWGSASTLSFPALPPPVPSRTAASEPPKPPHFSLDFFQDS